MVAQAKVWNPKISLSGIYLKIGHFPVKIGLIGGVGGVPEIRFSLESSSFCYLGAHAKFHNPSCLLSGRKVTSSEREKREERENNGKYYGHYVGACTAPLGPKSIHNGTEAWRWKLATHLDH